MQIQDDESGASYSIPIVVVSNDDYDEDQEQRSEEKLPVTENLIFMRYANDDGNLVDLASEDANDGAGGNVSGEVNKIGYVFYYPELNSCKVIECDPDSTPTMRDELRQFEQWICRMLYVINEHKHLKASSKNRAFLAEQEKRCARYCIETDFGVLKSQKVIGDIFYGTDEVN